MGVAPTFLRGGARREEGERQVAPPGEEAQNYIPK